jgi:hypothetical protein
MPFQVVETFEIQYRLAIRMSNQLQPSRRVEIVTSSEMETSHALSPFGVYGDSEARNFNYPIFPTRKGI